ncbi:hypothetical protein SAMN05444280_1316 [Tangfeifania diversioriginum]|uniref:Uncharacterized protein n=1 Tax=Tangfeifania diversioriginum TaxID=1168035 RepID=A0A1M6M8D8_9BACT|nr:hypothetical protein SAMN05444280_1316 [Tangfeifania diversioriginum]
MKKFKKTNLQSLNKSNPCYYLPANFDVSYILLIVNKLLLILVTFFQGDLNKVLTINQKTKIK